jgi:hypothetical protein
MIRLRRAPRRGLVALSLATGVMLVLLGLLGAYTLGLVAEQRQVEEAWASTQAYYAAQAGLAVLRASGRPQVSGACGAGRYVASARAGEVVSVGEVETSTGHVVRRGIPPGRGESLTP